jgi:Leucine-rich repeat (LRR) protein
MVLERKSRIKSSQRFRSLVKIYKEMKYLKKYNEQININDYLSSDGKTLNLYGLKLTQLPELTEGLEYLYCYNNKLTQLPELPKGLETLYCYNNDLTQLPELPEGLKYLDCSDNNLPYKNLKEYWEWYWKENPELKSAKDLGLW